MEVLLENAAKSLVNIDSTASNDTESTEWTIEDANELYLIDRWGSGYFDVGPDGCMRVAPLQERGSKIRQAHRGQLRRHRWGARGRHASSERSLEQLHGYPSHLDLR